MEVNLSGQRFQSLFRISIPVLAVSHTTTVLRFTLNESDFLKRDTTNPVPSKGIVVLLALSSLGFFVPEVLSKKKILASPKKYSHQTGQKEMEYPW